MFFIEDKCKGRMTEIIENCIFHNMFIPVVLVNILHIGILKEECYKNSSCNKLFTGIFCNSYLFVRQRV